MKVLVILVATLVAVVVGKPSAGIVRQVATPITYIAAPVVSSQYHSQDVLGQYAYGYSSPLHSKTEMKSLDGITQGGYSYIDAEGKLQSVEYVADSINGFRVAATNLPQQQPAHVEARHHHVPVPVVDTPEVAQAKVAHLAAVERAKIRNAAVAEQSPHSDSIEIGGAVVAAVPLAPTSAHLPSTRLIHASAIPVASTPVAHVRWAGPTSSYAYSTVVHQSSQPVVWGAAANLVAPVARVGHVAVVQHSAEGHPLDTPEVAEAKARHHQAVEEAKARIAKAQAQ